MRRTILIALVISAASSETVFAQGLIDLAGQGGPRDSATGPSVRKRVDHGRFDLQVSPGVQALAGEPGQKTLNLGAALQWNPVCGKFDLKADLHALLSKEAREEYLKSILSAVTSELLGSATELFCQSQPTACSILMNDNLAANLKLLYTNDLCTSLENAALSGARRGRADAVHRCMEEKLQQGKTKDEAEKACLNGGPEVRGFDGRVVGELDVNREIRRYVQFSDGGGQLLDGLTQDRKVGRSSINEDPKPNTVAERYETTREDYRKRLADAVGSARAGGSGGPSPADLEALVPPGAPPITRLEIDLIARRSDAEVSAFIASMSAAAALLKLTREMNEVERKLEALKGAPPVEGDADHAATLETLIHRIRSERERMLRLYADEERLGGVLAAGHALGQAEVARNRLDALRRAAVGEASRNIKTGTRPFGTPEGAPPRAESSRGSAGSSTSSSDCASCGLEYSFGAGGGGP